MKNKLIAKGICKAANRLHWKVPKQHRVLLYELVDLCRMHGYLLLWKEKKEKYVIRKIPNYDI